MEASKEQNSIFDIKISTVAPGFVSRPNEVQELSGIDLAMKLHYLRFVYYFRTQAFDGLTILNIKETMFNWLSHAYIPCGRIRRAESDSRRPYIKCNDSGVRTIEARCHLTLDEWLDSKYDSSHKLLVPNQVLGPDLAFSPLVFIQLTKFKCGSTSVGMSWSHVLGDAFSALSFIKLWSQAIVGQYPEQPLSMAQQSAHPFDNPSPNTVPGPDPLTIKRVGPVGDLWSTSSNSKMETLSFYISKSELTQLQAKICQPEPNQQVPLFECICVAIWQCVSKVRNRSGPWVVTICKSDVRNRTKGTITNKSQIISSVKTDVSITECNPMELGFLIMKQAVDERMKIEEAMERDGELPDFLIYGTNLTFVDLSDASFYEMEVRGQKPVYVNCDIDNIGDEGVVVVLPTPKDCSDGRIVSVTLPENEVVEIKSMLKEDWGIA